VFGQSPDSSEPSIEDVAFQNTRFLSKALFVFQLITFVLALWFLFERLICLSSQVI